MQTGNKDCGMFVLRYMKEIIHDKDLDFANKVTISLSFGFLIDFVFTLTLVKYVTYKKNCIIFQWLRRSNLVYTAEDINEIQIDFAKYFMKRYAS